MKTKTRWFLALPVLFATLTGCAGMQVRSTDGGLQPSPEDAIRASAAGDFSCTDSIGVKDVSFGAASEYVATGCGFLAHYRLTVDDQGVPQVVELSRSSTSTEPAAAVSAPVSSPANPS